MDEFKSIYQLHKHGILNVPAGANSTTHETDEDGGCQCGGIKKVPCPAEVAACKTVEELMALVNDDTSGMFDYSYFKYDHMRIIEGLVKAANVTPTYEEGATWEKGDHIKLKFHTVQNECRHCGGCSKGNMCAVCCETYEVCIFAGTNLDCLPNLVSPVPFIEPEEPTDQDTEGCEGDDEDCAETDDPCSGENCAEANGFTPLTHMECPTKQSFPAGSFTFYELCTSRPEFTATVTDLNIDMIVTLGA